MKIKNKKILDILIRYAILIIVAIPNLYIFYFLFKPLTIYLSYFFLDIFFNTNLSGNVILIKNFPIVIINACVAGSAYYLLLILNLTTPKIKIKKRIKTILFCFGTFLLINVLRIFFLSILALSESSLFDITHKIFWYLGSVVFVIGIWFLTVKIFKIKNIPIYSDLTFLYKNLK